MSIGAGIVLFVIGAILVYAVDIDLDAINLDLIGYILMGAGAIVFVIGLILLLRGRQSSTVTHTQDANGTQRVTRTDTTVSGDPTV